MLVLLVPSVKDILSDHAVFPQCEFDKDVFQDPVCFPLLSWVFKILKSHHLACQNAPQSVSLYA